MCPNCANNCENKDKSNSYNMSYILYKLFNNKIIGLLVFYVSKEFE